MHPRQVYSQKGVGSAEYSRWCWAHRAELGLWIVGPE